MYYIHADHLGTPRKITRPSDNQVVWTWESEAFGTSLPDQNPSGLGNFVFNLRFPGQYYDQETGLHYKMASGIMIHRPGGRARVTRLAWREALILMRMWEEIRLISLIHWGLKSPLILRTQLKLITLLLEVYP